MSQNRDTVLVVDDSPETLSFLTEALEETGVVVLLLAIIYLVLAKPF